MSTASFQFRDPLNRNPYVADQSNPIIYPYARWGDFATSPYLYVYGRPLDFRSYYGEDLNLSARPITRVIQPTVLEYAALQPRQPSLASLTGQCGTRGLVNDLPLVLNNRFASIGAQVDDVSAAAEDAASKRRRTMNTIIVVILLFAGIAAAAWFLKKKQ